MRTHALAALFLLVPTAAFAQEEPSVGEQPAPKPESALQARQVDVRAGVTTTPVLQYGGVAAAGDVGFAKLGPGVLAGGGGLAYDACGTQCVSAPYEKFQTHLWMEGRLSYHLSTPHMPHFDFYPLATAGLVLAHSSVHVMDSDYKATNLAPTISFGGGAAYFLSKRWFVSGEARLRFAGGEYGYELANGTPVHPSLFDRSKVDSWTATTIDLALSAGARF